MARDTHAEAELMLDLVQNTPSQRFEQARTLHEVLAMAIVDFEAVLVDPRYIIDFNGWHVAMGMGSLAVCAAGAVMAKRFRAGDRHALPEDFPKAQNQLEAVYLLSIGRIIDAAAVLTVKGGVLIAAAIDGVPFELLSPKAAAAAPLAERWEPILENAISAKFDKVESRRHLGHLIDLQRDLAREGL
jgi:hypothetical protein